MEDRPKTIIICSNYAWTIHNFRMPLIKRLKKEGYKVCVLTQFDGYESFLAGEVDQVKPLFISRKGVNPFIDLFTIFDFIINFIRLKPAVVLLFTVKPVIYGSIAARLLKIRSVVMITGLGTAFIAHTWITEVVKILYKFSLASVGTAFFQNVDDRDLFVSNKLIASKVCRLIPGSGVDLEKFSLAELPNKRQITFLLIGRMIWDKGIAEFVEAAKKVKAIYPHARFQLLGPLGVENRTSIPKERMEKWQKDGIIQYLGETDDVKPYIERACCIVLPSYREGTSRVLLEAAAMGRPLIATNVPGCREVIKDGVNGFLCKSRDYLDLANKIELMFRLPYETRRIMGIRGRQKVENEFNQDIVCDRYIDMIDTPI